MYALEEELDFYKSLGWKDVYNAVLPGDIWWCCGHGSWCMHMKKKEQERNEYFAEIRRLYDKYIKRSEKDSQKEDGKSGDLLEHFIVG